MEPLQIVPLSALRRKVDFGIITMREDEFGAVLKRFPPKWVIIDGECQYNVADLENRAGKPIYVAIVRTTEPGHSEAQAAATHLQNELDPSCLVLVGIGGAKPESEFTLGDVVAGTRLHDFSITAAIANSNVKYAVSGGPAHRRVQTALANLVATQSLLGDWNSEAAVGKTLPPVDLTDDKFVGDDSWKEKVRKSLKFRFCSPEGQRPPLATAATLGSGNVLMKDPALLQEWLEFARDLKAVEMELPGVFAAARSIKGDRPVLAIRGISDVVGFIRDPRWTEYACHTAASFARAFLTSGLLNISVKPKDRTRARVGRAASATEPKQGTEKGIHAADQKLGRVDKAPIFANPDAAAEEQKRRAETTRPTKDEKPSSQVAAPTQLVVECVDTHTGKPLSGVNILARGSGLTASAKTDEAGLAGLTLAGTRLEQLLANTAPTHWGAYRTNISLREGDLVRIDVDPVSLPYRDAIVHYYGASKFDPTVGVTVGVVDSGVGPHSDINLVGGVNTVTGERAADYEDWKGHGTHVAGLIGASQLPQSGVRGIAPGVRIRSYRVFGLSADSATNYSIMP